MSNLKGWIKAAVDRPLQSLIAVILLEIILILVLPASQKTLQIYNINASEYKILLFATTIPTIIAWGTAFWAYHNLSKYQTLLGESSEAKHFANLGRGITWLAWSLPVTSLTNLILNGFSYEWPGFRPASIIIGNYVGLMLVLIAFVIISRAGRDLMDYVKLQFGLASTRAIVFLFAFAGISYCYFTFKTVDTTSLWSSNNLYFLPVWLILLTVVLPYLCVWFNGFLAVYEIGLVSQKISGLLYRRALRYLAGGLVIVIIASIMLQYINGVQPRTGYLLLDYKLVLNTVIRLCRAAGFGLMAYGAMKLKRIEEV